MGLSADSASPLSQAPPTVPTPAGCLPGCLWGLNALRARCLVGAQQRPAGPSGCWEGLSLKACLSCTSPALRPAVPGAAENSKSGKSRGWSSCPLPRLPLLQHPSQSPLPLAPLSYFLWAPLLLCGLELVPTTLPWTPNPAVNCLKTMSGELLSLGVGGCEGRGDSVKMGKGWIGMELGGEGAGLP